MASPIQSPYQSEIPLPMNITEENNCLSLSYGNNESVINPTEDSNNRNLYYITPSETPRIQSPAMNDMNDNRSPSIGSPRILSDKRNKKRTVMSVLEDIIDPSRQSSDNRHKKYNVEKSNINQKPFKEFQLQNGKKCKVIYEGQFSRWTEEDPFSIYSDDVTRFSTSPNSTVEQHRDGPFDRIANGNNGYWQRCNYLITRNEVVIFPNAKWDNKVIEVMTITEDINILIASILITKLEWVIEMKNSESNVYTQSNYYSNISKQKREEENNSNSKGHDAKSVSSTTKNEMDDAKLMSTNKTEDVSKASEEKEKSKTQHKSSSSSLKNGLNSSSRQCKWILRFDDRESMLYFISLIKYTQTKKSSKKLHNEEEVDSLENSDFSSISSSEEDNDEEEGRNNKVSKEVTRSPLSPYVETKTIKEITTPKIVKSSPQNLVVDTKLNGIVHHERKSPLFEQIYSSYAINNEEKDKTNPNPNMLSTSLDTKNTRRWSGLSTKSLGTSLERKDSLNLRYHEKKFNVVKGEEGAGAGEGEGKGEKEKRRNIEELDQKSNSKTNANSRLRNSILMAELDLKKLEEDYNKKKNRNSKVAETNDNKIKEEEKSLQDGYQKSDWQSAKDRVLKKKRSSYNNSSTANFTNIQLSYLDIIENKLKNKNSKLNKDPATMTAMDATATEPLSKSWTEEDTLNAEKTPKMGQQQPTKYRHRRSSSLPPPDYNNLFTPLPSDDEVLNSNTKSQPIAIPLPSSSINSFKYNSISPADIGISNALSSNLGRSHSISGKINMNFSGNRLGRKESITGRNKTNAVNPGFYSPRINTYYVEESNNFYQKPNNSTGNLVPGPKSKRMSSLVNLENLKNSYKSPLIGSKTPQHLKSSSIDQKFMIDPMGDSKRNSTPANNLYAISLNNPQAMENGEPETILLNNNYEVDPNISSLMDRTISYDTPALMNTMSQPVMMNTMNQLNPMNQSTMMNQSFINNEGPSVNNITLVNGKICPKRNASLYHYNSNGNLTVPDYMNGRPRGKVVSALYRKNSVGKSINENIMTNGGANTSNPNISVQSSRSNNNHNPRQSSISGMNGIQSPRLSGSYTMSIQSPRLSMQSSRPTSVYGINNMQSSRNSAYSGQSSRNSAYSGQSSRNSAYSGQSSRPNSAYSGVNSIQSSKSSNSNNSQPSRHNSTSTSDGSIQLSRRSSARHARPNNSISSINKLDISGDMMKKKLTNSRMRPFSIATDNPYIEIGNGNNTMDDPDSQMNRLSSHSDNIKVPANVNMSYSLGDQYSPSGDQALVPSIMDSFFNQTPHMTIPSMNGSVNLPQSPTNSRPNSIFINNTLNPDLFKPATDELPLTPELVLTYKDAYGQVVEVVLDDESIIPNSFLRPFKKNSKIGFDLMILNSLEILKVIEQTYL